MFVFVFQNHTPVKAVVITNAEHDEQAVNALADIVSKDERFGVMSDDPTDYWAGIEEGIILKLKGRPVDEGPQAAGYSLAEETEEDDS